MNLKRLLLRNLLSLLIGFSVLTGVFAGEQKQKLHLDDVLVTHVDALGNSSEIGLSRFKGKPVLLEVWASWCAPCLAALPHLEQIAKDFPDVQVLPVSVDEGGAGAVANAYRRTGVTALPMYLDNRGEMTSSFAVRIYPTTLLFDACGQPVLRAVGGRPDTYKALRRAIERLKDGKCATLEAT